MTERIRTLLDEATADVRPRIGDPSGAIVRRATTRRRRIVGAAAAVATLTVISTGAVASVTLRPHRPTPAATAAATPMPKSTAFPAPFHPEADGSAVRVNGLVLPLTGGWRFQHFQEVADACDIPVKTMAVAEHGITRGACNLRALVTIGHGGLTTAAMWRPIGPIPWQGLHEVVLPGGQPLWLDDDEIHNFDAFAKYSGIFPSASFDAPWADASFHLDAPTPMFLPYLRGIRSEPVPRAKLALPDAPKAVYVSIKGDTVTSSDRATIQQVIQRLQALDRTVDPAQPICPGGRAFGPWTLAAQDMAELAFTTDDPYGRHYTLAMVALSTSTSCAFATSSNGGRVWLPEGFVAQLHELVQAGS